MAMVMEQPEVIKSMQAALSAAKPIPREIPTGPAIEDKPLVGAEINIKLSLSPGMITLIAAPVTVLVTMVVGWVLLKSLNAPLYGGEMLAGAVVNTAAGVAASIPLFIFMRKGVQAIAQAALLGIAVRCGMCLMGLMLAMGPGWALDKMPLAYWVFAFYFPLLAVETGVVVWLANKAKH